MIGWIVFWYHKTFCGKYRFSLLIRYTDLWRRHHSCPYQSYKMFTSPDRHWLHFRCSDCWSIWTFLWFFLFDLWSSINDFADGRHLWCSDLDSFSWCLCCIYAQTQCLFSKFLSILSRAGKYVKTRAVSRNTLYECGDDFWIH